MAEGEFQVVFHGEITGDQPVEVVKQQLANLFRMPAERVEALFSGKPVVVKKNIDEATARKLEQAFLRAGAACEVRAPAAAPETPDRSSGTAAPTPPESREDRHATGPATPSPDRTSGSIAAAGDPNHTVIDLAVPDSFEGLEIDTSDAPLTTPREYPAPEIDTSGLSLAADDAGPLSERKPPPPADIDTSGLSMESLDGER